MTRRIIAAILTHHPKQWICACLFLVTVLLCLLNPVQMLGDLNERDVRKFVIKRILGEPDWVDMVATKIAEEEIPSFDKHKAADVEKLKALVARWINEWIEKCRRSGHNDLVDDLLLRGGEYYSAIEKSDQAVVLYKRILKEYPDSTEGDIQSWRSDAGHGACTSGLHDTSAFEFWKKKQSVATGDIAALRVASILTREGQRTAAITILEQRVKYLFAKGRLSADFAKELPLPKTDEYQFRLAFNFLRDTPDKRAMRMIAEHYIKDGKHELALESYKQIFKYWPKTCAWAKEAIELLRQRKVDKLFMLKTDFDSQMYVIGTKEAQSDTKVSEHQPERENKESAKQKLRVADLMKKLTDKSTTEDKQDDIIMELAEFKDASSVPTLIERVQNGHVFLVRQNAAYALGEIGDKRAVQPLINLLEKPEKDEAVRRNAIYALIKIGDPVAISALRKIANNDQEYPLCREEAQRAINLLNSAEQ